MSDPFPITESIVLPLEQKREPFWNWLDVALFAVGADDFGPG